MYIVPCQVQSIFQAFLYKGNIEMQHKGANCSFDILSGYLENLTPTGKSPSTSRACMTLYSRHTISAQTMSTSLFICTIGNVKLLRKLQTNRTFMTLELCGMNIPEFALLAPLLKLRPRSFELFDSECPLDTFGPFVERSQNMAPVPKPFK